MSYAYETAAVEILRWLHHAERDLVDRTVATMNGEAGTVRAVKLDEHHGLCFTLDEPSINGRRFYPVSTIKLRSP